MSYLLSALEKVVLHLNSLNIQHALVGGFAVSFYGYERTTKDLDLAILTETDAEAERVIKDLFSLGFEQKAVLGHEPTGRLATVRLTTPTQQNKSVVVDLLFASSGIEPEIVLESEIYEVAPGLKVHVAKIAHLLAMKILAFDSIRRAQDGADIMALLKLVKEKELEEVKKGLSLITQRGFARGKDLLAEFNLFIEAHSKESKIFIER